MEKWTGRITVGLPLTAVPDGAGGVQLSVRSQGCLEGELCYPPTDQVLLVSLPPAGSGPVLTQQAPASTLAGILGDSLSGAAVDAAGLYVTGFIIGALPGQTSAGGADGFLRKYDFGGNELWTRQFGTAETDKPDAVAIHAGAIYVTGSTAGAMGTPVGGRDLFVRRYDATGTAVESCNGLDDDCDGATDENGIALCDDGNSCNGQEVCGGVAGCQAGSPPSVSMVVSIPNGVTASPGGTIAVPILAQPSGGG